MNRLAKFCLAVLVSLFSMVANAAQTAVMDLQNIHCYACVMTVKKALERVPGVENTKVDLERKTATVKFDPARTNTDALVKATKDAGFPATLRK